MLIPLSPQPLFFPFPANSTKISFWWSSSYLSLIHETNITLRGAQRVSWSLRPVTLSHLLLCDSDGIWVDTWQGGPRRRNLRASEDLAIQCAVVRMWGLELSSYFFFSSYIYLFIYWLRWVFVVARGLSLVAPSRGYSWLWCTGFSLWWFLLLWSTGSRRVGFSSCGTRTQ